MALYVEYAHVVVLTVWVILLYVLGRKGRKDWRNGG